MKLEHTRMPWSMCFNSIFHALLYSDGHSDEICNMWHYLNRLLWTSVPVWKTVFNFLGNFPKHWIRLSCNQWLLGVWFLKHRTVWREKRTGVGDSLLFGGSRGCGRLVAYPSALGGPCWWCLPSLLYSQTPGCFVCISLVELMNIFSHACWPSACLLQLSDI